ncbi:hypothetical protein D3C81_814550 [compost metagenome]
MPFALCLTAISLAIFSPYMAIPKEWLVLGGAFFIGNICYIYRGAIIKIINPYVAIIAFVASIAVVYALPYANLVRPSVQIFDFLSFAAMVIFAITSPQLPKLKADLSYSLYLIHCLVIGQLVFFIPLGPRLFCFVMLSSLPICYASWYLIEKPALSLKSRFNGAVRAAPKVEST